MKSTTTPITSYKCGGPLPKGGGVMSDLENFLVTVCVLCLDGKGGECHTPGCMFFICPAPTWEQALRFKRALELERLVAKEQQP